jgi:hypothetical protein
LVFTIGAKVAWRQSLFTGAKIRVHKARMAPTVSGFQPTDIQQPQLSISTKKPGLHDP